MIIEISNLNYNFLVTESFQNVQCGAWDEKQTSVPKEIELEVTLSASAGQVMGET